MEKMGYIKRLRNVNHINQITMNIMKIIELFF